MEKEILRDVVYSYFIYSIFNPVSLQNCEIKMHLTNLLEQLNIGSAVIPSGISILELPEPTLPLSRRAMNIR